MEKHQGLPDYPPGVSVRAAERAISIEKARKRYLHLRDVLLASGASEVEGRIVPREIVELGNTIVRRENPNAVQEMVQSKKPLTIYPIDAATGTRYSNCAAWNPSGTSGLDNALHEGMTDADGVVTVIGFLPPLEGDLTRLPDATSEFYGLDRHAVRSFMGTLDFNELRFIRVRVPIEAVPEELMNEDEQDLLDQAVAATVAGTPRAIHYHRWFVFPRQLQ